jgi:hypothetical protein
MADRQIMFSKCWLVWNMLLAVLFQKWPKFGHLEFKPGDFRGHHPVTHILEEFVSWVEYCCICVKSTAYFKNSVACSLYIVHSVHIAPTVISWSIQYFCCKPDILRFYRRLWRNRLFLPTNLTLTLERMQSVPQWYRKLELNSLNCS